MADKPVHEVEGVDTALDALAPSPSSSDVYEAVDLFSSKAVAAVAAKRSLSAGGGSSSFTDVVTVDPLPNDLTGRTFAALGPLEPHVVWDYDGDQVFSVAITGYLPNTRLTFASDDDLSANPSGYTDNNGDLTLTKTDVGFSPGDGPSFAAHIHTPAGLFGDRPTLRTLSVGTPYAATEDYRLGVFVANVNHLGGEPATAGSVTRGSANFVADSASSTPVFVFAADGQAVPLIWVFAADATTLFRMDNDGTPHFHGAGVPQVPAIPTAQDVTDALVALGLVTQAP